MALPKPLLHIPYMYVMVAMFCMAAGSLIVCLFLGTLLHLDETTGTHCEVGMSLFAGPWRGIHFVFQLGEMSFPISLEISQSWFLTTFINTLY